MLSICSLALLRSVAIEAAALFTDIFKASPPSALEADLDSTGSSISSTSTSAETFCLSPPHSVDADPGEPGGVDKLLRCLGGADAIVAGDSERFCEDAGDNVDATEPTTGTVTADDVEADDDVDAASDMVALLDA